MAIKECKNVKTSLKAIIQDWETCHVSSHPNFIYRFLDNLTDFPYKDVEKRIIATVREEKRIAFPYPNSLLAYSAGYSFPEFDGKIEFYYKDQKQGEYFFEHGYVGLLFWRWSNPMFIDAVLIQNPSKVVGEVKLDINGVHIYSVMEHLQRINTSLEEFEEIITTGKRVLSVVERYNNNWETCFICGRAIHNRHAIDDAKLLEKYTGQKSGVLCCSCFNIVKMIEKGKGGGAI